MLQAALRRHAASWAIAQPVEDHRCGAGRCSARSMSLFPYLGTSFIPELQEGTISPNMDRVPNIALDESIKMEMRGHAADRASCKGVKHVVSRLGRGESPVDPAGYNESDMMIQLAAAPKSAKGITQEEIADKVRDKLALVPRRQSRDGAADLGPRGRDGDRRPRRRGRQDFRRRSRYADRKSATKWRSVAGTIRGTRRHQGRPRLRASRTSTSTSTAQAIARHGLNVGRRRTTSSRRPSAASAPPRSTRASAASRPSCACRNTSATASTTSATSCLRRPTASRCRSAAWPRSRLLEGPSQIKREMAKRRIVVGVNVRDRDLGGFVAELQQKRAQEGQAPARLLLRVGRPV